MTKDPIVLALSLVHFDSSRFEPCKA